MQFRSYEDLSWTIYSNLHRIPSDVDLVVGVPRSGLLAAHMVALALNLPVADLEGFLVARFLRSGSTRAQMQRESWGHFKKAILIDDSINSGGTMRDAVSSIVAANLRDKVVVAAVYGVDNHSGVDLIFEKVPLPRMFEWNFMHHPYLARACLDIDGVLCLDPTYRENDDGAGYASFLADARRRIIPTVPIGRLVTSRLEKYRQETEAWLKANDVIFGQLDMLNLPDADARRRKGARSSYKASVYAASDAIIFIESEHEQAIEIAGLSGKPVLSVEGHRVVSPGASIAASLQLIKGARNWLTLSSWSPTFRLRRLARLLLGETVYRAFKKAVRSVQRQHL